MEHQSDLFPSSIKIDNTAGAIMRSIASWAMIVVVTTVLGYVVSIADLIINPATADEPQPEGFSGAILSGGSSIGGTIITILIGLLINYFLYRFAAGIPESINSRDIAKFGISFRQLKIYFAITAIIMILLLLILLMALAAVL